MLLHQRVLFKTVFEGCLVDQHFAILGVVYQILTREGVAAIHYFVTVCSKQQAAVRLGTVINFNGYDLF